MNRFDVTPIYVDDDKSIVGIVLDGSNRRVKNEICLNEYWLVSGLVRFVIENDPDNPIVLSEPGVVFRVPAGTVYQDFGENAVMLCISTPPFDPAQVTVVE